MQRRIVQQAEARARQHDGVDAAGSVDQSVLLMSKSFPRHALDAVALGGQSNVFFCYYDTETGVVELIGACEYQQFFC